MKALTTYENIRMQGLHFQCQAFFQSMTSTIVIRNGKLVRKHEPYCWYFRLNLKYVEWPYRKYIKTTKNGGFCEELISENDFEAVLATFFCTDNSANASEAAQKIVTDQKDDHMCSSCVIVCWISNIYQSITVQKVG